MIVLDTNVISEMKRPKPAAAVAAWFRAHRTSALFTTALTQTEILYGMTLLPDGQRREAFRVGALQTPDNK